MKIEKRRIQYNVIITLFFCLLYGLSGPLEIYAGNMNEFRFGAKDFLWPFIIVTILAWIILTIILSLVPTKIEQFGIAGLFTISFISYLQNMFMNKDIFNADGSAVEWDKMQNATAINSLIWIALIILIFFVRIKKKQICLKAFFYISAFISCVIIISTIFLIPTLTYNKTLDDKYMFDAKEQYYVGSEDNVIVFFLDKYGNGEFDSLYSKDAHFADALKDFTYYNNMNSTYAYTSPSIVYDLSTFKTDSSNLVDYDYNYADHAWKSDVCSNIYSDIREAGYEPYLYSLGEEYICGKSEILADVMSSMKKVPVKVDNFLLFRLLSKMTLYKYTPLALKKPFEVRSTSFSGVLVYLEGEPAKYYNADYYEALNSNGLSIDKENDKKFIVYHIEGMHDFTIDELVNPVEPMSYEEGCDKTQKGLMEILNTYFDELKSLDLYDSSTIIVLGDHGLAYDKYDPQPVFFIKPAGQVQEEMTINAAPISSEDIMPTVLDSMGIDGSKYGNSIYDWHEGDSRIRYLGYPEFNYEMIEYDGDKNELIDKIKKLEQGDECLSSE